jgi:Predicted ornithine cyclodeaminase, mu-crystallin homolog
MRQLWR